MEIPPPYQHRVLYGDTDQMGVVYYASYLRFFEGCRNEWIRALGLTYFEIEARGIMLPVLEAGVRYLRPARYDDLLEVSTKVTHTRVKIRFDYVVKKHGEVQALCLGHTVHACVTREGRPTRAPEWLMSALAPAASLRRTLDGGEGVRIAVERDVSAELDAQATARGAPAAPAPAPPAATPTAGATATQPDGAAGRDAWDKPA